mmetsp:Transcript_2548/g.10072  ORF Transcript_2548/g.10072 Transcript_2548/m.10072 type:complete len:292 (+) Transcript_2548:113-988(+)
MYFMGAKVLLWYGHGPCLCMASMCALTPYPLCASKPYSGCFSAISTIMRSRVTFASTDAAAMHTDLASPLTIASARSAKGGGTRLPSINTQSAFVLSPSTLRAMASMVASRMLISSMRSWSITHTDLSTRSSAMSSSNTASRSSSVICLLSLMASMTRSSGNTHAAATTGPASGPRPASSTPQTTALPASQHRRSCSRDGPAFLGFFASFSALLASASALVVRLRPDARVGLLPSASFAATGTSTLMWSTILMPFFKNAPRPCCVVVLALGGIAGRPAERASARKEGLAPR